MRTSLSKPFHVGIRAVLPTIAAIALALVVVPVAHASSELFTLSPTGNTGEVTLAGNGTDVTVGIPSNFSGNTTAVAAGIDNGTFSFSPVTLTAGPNNGLGIYPINTTSGTFSYASVSDSDKLAGNVTWSYAKDGSNIPDLVGTITVTSSSGDATFESALSSVLGFDLAIGPTADGSILDAIVTNSLSTTAPLSSGEVDATPEPGSLALIAIGIGLIGFAVRRRNVLGDLSAA